MTLSKGASGAPMSGPDLAFYRGDDLPEGKVAPRREIRISPNDRGFIFADGVYEVIRSYSGRLFRMDEHLARLKRSLGEIRIGFTDLPLIRTKAIELIERNGLQSCDATVYVQITRGVCPRAHAFPCEPVLPTVYMEASAFSPREQDMANGVGVITVSDTRWARCDIKSIGLLPNVLARQSAVEQGVFEAIFVRDGVITEGTHTNIFGVKDGKVLTHTRTGSILGGITRDVVLELCQAQNLPVAEWGMLESQLPEIDELFLAGTTVEITPVTKVNGTQICDGKPGPLTRRLQKAFRDFLAAWLQAGKKQRD